MKRERMTIKSWIHSSTQIHSSRHIGVWSIDALQNNDDRAVQVGQTYRLVNWETDIPFIG